jgi:hypothetical protein
VSVQRSADSCERSRPPVALATASAIPAAMSDSRRLSVTNCLTSRPMGIPSATRTPISRRRRSARINSRLATLAIAMMRTTPPRRPSRGRSEMLRSGIPLIREPMNGAPVASVPNTPTSLGPRAAKNDAAKARELSAMSGSCALAARNPVASSWLSLASVAPGSSRAMISRKVISPPRSLRGRCLQTRVRQCR